VIFNNQRWQQPPSLSYKIDFKFQTIWPSLTKYRRLMPENNLPWKSWSKVPQSKTHDSGSCHREIPKSAFTFKQLKIKTWNFVRNCPSAFCIKKYGLKRTLGQFKTAILYSQCFEYRKLAIDSKLILTHSHEILYTSAQRQQLGTVT
jgi:hypothetical protein